MADDREVLAEILKEIRHCNQQIARNTEATLTVRHDVDELQRDVDDLKAKAEVGAELDEAWQSSKKAARVTVKVMLTLAAVVSALAVIVDRGAGLWTHTLDALKSLLTRN